MIPDLFEYIISRALYLQPNRFGHSGFDLGKQCAKARYLYSANICVHVYSLFEL